MGCCLVSHCIAAKNYTIYSLSQVDNTDILGCSGPCQLFCCKICFVAIHTMFVVVVDLLTVTWSNKWYNGIHGCLLGCIDDGDE